MKRSYLLLVLLLSLVMIGPGVVQAQSPEVEGLMTVQSAASVEETAGQLQSAIEDQGLIFLTTVDHAANAESVGQELRPTRLLIFGNPNLGTQLMQNQQTVAIDLPQKYLVWEDESGQVNISYNDPQYLRNRHSLEGTDEVLATISGALGNFANTVSTAEEMAAEETETEESMAGEPAAEAETTPQELPATGADQTVMPWLLIGGGILLVSLAIGLRKRKGSKLILFIALPLLIFSFSAVTTAQTDSRGLVTVDSPQSVEETVNRLQTTMEERGLTVMTTVNHAMNAENVGMSLPATQLIIFGNPELGTQLMQSSQTVGIDLPQKMLVWEDGDGQVHVTYNDPQYIGQRHNITDRDEVLGTISNALSGLAEAATAP